MSKKRFAKDFNEEDENLEITKKPGKEWLQRHSISWKEKYLHIEKDQHIEKD